MSSSDSKASSQITTSGLINKFNNILSQTSEFQKYDGSIDNEIFSGGYIGVDKSDRLGGARFRVWLPVQDPEAGASA